MNEPTWYVGAHPRVYGAGLAGDIALVDKIDSSPCIRGRYRNLDFCNYERRFIPVYTGQILNPSSKSVGWADRRFLSRLPTIKSVCIIFLRCIFADNTFWSKTDGYRIHLLFRMYPNPANPSGHSSKRENPKMISDNSHKNRGVTGEHPSFYAKTKNGMSVRCPKPILIP